MQVFGSIRWLDVRSLAGPVLDVNVPAGARLVHEGHAIGTFFVIRTGQAEVVQQDRVVGMLAAGDCFGEIDPDSTEPQPVSVVATTPMRLVTFSSHGIDRLCAAIPDARERIRASLPDAWHAPAPAYVVAG
jgi:CRP-like cAMP-binding protein